jgi:hypothetical protein
MVHGFIVTWGPEGLREAWLFGGANQKLVD